MVGCAVNNGVSMPVMLWGSGEPRREFLHVDDLAAAAVYSPMGIGFMLAPVLTAALQRATGDYSVAVGVDVVINATSIGLFPDVEGQLALDLDSLTSGMMVADVIPNPPRTNLIKDAEFRDNPPNPHYVEGRPPNEAILTR